MLKTYELEAQIAHAKAAVISRIEALMMPAAEALCNARRQTDDYWLQREVSVNDHARLIWLSQSLKDARPRSSESRASVQIILPDDATPELLARMQALAVDKTAQILRECEGRIAEMKALTESTVAAYEAI